MVDKIKIAQAQENETKKNRVKVDPIPDAGMGFANPLGEMKVNVLLFEVSFFFFGKTTSHKNITLQFLSRFAMIQMSKAFG